MNYITQISKSVGQKEKKRIQYASLLPNKCRTPKETAKYTITV